MNYQKKYLNFINGRYASEGVRITVGILLPSFVMLYFDMLPVGIVLSVGALCVSVADAPGAVKHRVAGMFACCLLVTAMSVMVYYASANAVVLGAFLVVCGFVLSMLTVYGNRSSAVGIAAMIIMVLSLQAPVHGRQIWVNAGYTLAGGTWYMLYSLLLYRLRPYKFIQQVLADYITEIAAYLRLRGNFYDYEPDYDKVNEQLFQQQINVEAQQHMLSELLFNTRAIVKESTQTGRVLIKIYLEVAELYTSIMTTYQHYSEMHKAFDNTGILETFRTSIALLAKELEEIGLGIRTGLPSLQSDEVKEQVAQARNRFEELRVGYMNEGNVENFVGLGRIMRNLEDLSAKIGMLHTHTTYDVQYKKINIESAKEAHLSPTEDLRPSLFFDNLNFKSNIFRHALRMAFALLVGYLVSGFFKVDRGYWVLLTLVVILKPAYSLSKTRNSDRLIGTLIGVVLGMLLLFFVKNESVLLGLMIFFMAGSYMFIRTNYFLSVLLMTPYLMIFFQLLFPGNINELMKERIIDTGIGSAIAFFASLFLVPAWEKNTIRTYMKEMLEANKHYYEAICRQFMNEQAADADEIKKARRTALIVLANLSDAFTRMLSEPKRHRQGTKNVHKFVVLNHTLVSHLATLSYLLQTKRFSFPAADFIGLIHNTKLYFNNSINILEQNNEQLREPDLDNLKTLNEKIAALVEKRKTEIANGQLETITKKELVEAKSVTDQFNYIFSDVAVICKLASEHEREMGSAG
jgi:uncharacterized membrane protein (TIGR01666 family)